MAEKTKIEWADSTFNPVIGCTKISPACDNCYAEGWAKRSGLVEWGNAPRRRTSAATWAKPRQWQRKAGEFFSEYGRRRRVFCASLADVFDNQWDPQWRVDLWDLIRECPDLDWLLLTKRPQNIAKMLPPDWGDGWDNVWLGTTVENQEVADRNVPILLNVPAKVRFLSMEPLLGPVELTCINIDGESTISALKARTWEEEIEDWRDTEPDWKESFLDWFDLDEMPTGIMWPAVDWIITGGESGPGARPMHPDWVRDIRDQCEAAGVPNFFKQWGEWVHWEFFSDGFMNCNKYDRLGNITEIRARMLAPYRNGFVQPEGDFRRQGNFLRVGKKAAGRLLDGVEHNGFPGGRS